MVRLISWAVGFVYRTSLRCLLLGWMVVRFLLPIVIRVVWFVAWLLIRIASFSVISLFIGVPTTIRRMAASWTGRVLAMGVPVEYDLSVYRSLAVVAFVVLLSGWTVLGAVIWLVWTHVLIYI